MSKGFVTGVILSNKYRITVPKNHSIVRVTHSFTKEDAALSKWITFSLVKEKQYYTSVWVQWPDKIKFKLIVDTTEYNDNDNNLPTMLGMLHYDRYIYQLSNRVELIKKIQGFGSADED